jgi:hypothetical protein
METLQTTKLHTLENPEGKTQPKTHRISSSKLNFFQPTKDLKDLEILPEVVWKPVEFAKFLNGKANFDAGFVFFRTGEIQNTLGQIGSLEVVCNKLDWFNGRALLCNFNGETDELRFKFLDDGSFYLENFLYGGMFDGYGFGHTIMNLLKQAVDKISLVSSRHSVDFYLKEGFVYDDPKYWNGLSRLVWKK